MGENGSQSGAGLSPEVWLFGVFGLVIVLFLVIDLGLFQRKSHKISFQSAVRQSLFWFSISLGYGFMVWYFDGHEHGIQWLSAYLTEYSLSVDNIFVFILLFRHFRVREEYHHRILYYGVFGAILFRALFIGVGAIVVEQFHYILYFFGIVLLYTGFNMLKQEKDEAFDPEDSFVYRFLNKRLRFLPGDGGGKFIVVQDGKRWFTILFLVVVLIETTDIIFAVDSIPAVFSISQSPFVVYTSNIFAIMGLRAMYFMLESVIDKFRYLQQGISFVLMFIGAKMLMGLGEEFGWGHFHLPDWVSLCVIVLMIGGSVAASLLIPEKDAEDKH